MVMVIGLSQLYLVTSCEGPVAAWMALWNHFERLQVNAEEAVLSHGDGGRNFC